MAGIRDGLMIPENVKLYGGDFRHIGIWAVSC